MPSTFMRHEQKYLLGEAEYTQLLAEIVKHMQPDKFCRDGQRYVIYNLYYDTPNNDVIRHSLSKPYYKEKLRLRSYAVPSGPQDMVFLELKKKIGGVVSKRRASLPLGQVDRFLSKGIRPVRSSYINDQVVTEIACFLERYPVEPKVMLSYERMAFFGRDDRDFRLTFDNNILTRRDNLRLEWGAGGEQLLGDRPYLMEIKLSSAYPLWLCRALSALGLYSTSFSKYGNEYKRYCAESPTLLPAAPKLATARPAPILLPNYGLY